MSNKCFNAEVEERLSNASLSQVPTFWLTRAASRSDWQMLWRCTLNLCGALGFLIGSVGWVANFLLIGTFLFAGANVFYIITGVWWAVSSKKALMRRFEKSGTRTHLLESSDFEDGLPLAQPGLIPRAAPQRMKLVLQPDKVARAFLQLTRVEIMAAVCQVLGAVGFTTGCFLSLNPDSLLETNFLYLFGSCLFMIQGILGQLMCDSMAGPLLPILPKAHRLWRTVNPARRILSNEFVPPRCCSTSPLCLHRIVPGALFNTLGSLLFVIGSFALFYEQYLWFGGWGYTLGSILFVCCSLADLNGFLDALAIRFLQMEA